MTNDEAESLARHLRSLPRLGGYRKAVNDLCDHVISGNMRREIMGEAYEAAAINCEREAEACLSDIVRGDELGRREANARAGALVTAAADIRSLIQPLAQKENGE